MLKYRFFSESWSPWPITLPTFTRIHQIKIRIQNFEFNNAYRQYHEPCSPELNTLLKQTVASLTKPLSLLNRRQGQKHNQPKNHITGMQLLDIRY